MHDVIPGPHATVRWAYRSLTDKELAPGACVGGRVDGR